MPQTIRQGATDHPVRSLQTMLNMALPTVAPPLAVDGIFGPRTLARTLQFQRSAGLVADGIVGPKTWAALDRACVPPKTAQPISCGTGDAANHNSARAMVASSSSTFGIRSSVRGGAIPALAGVTPLAGSTQEAVARATFGDSLIYDSIFISPLVGLQNRPFTTAVPIAVSPSRFVQVLNMGATFQDHDLIHELTHAWQSQHHPDPTAYMVACVKCQALAVKQNAEEVVFHPSIATNTDFPVNYPFSAYASTRGKGFGDYGGEQIAQHVERRLGGTTGIIRAAAPGSIHAGNVLSLTRVVTDDLRKPDIII